ncbi:hypothetical protein [Microbulbifer spongiae]|uniref:DUF2975 domain-containing protein n=1 Tax=Microbulbifer spongiae TaxID=2944933 RepID=A0ABY9ECL5_9GAMM|nr:hypothetical protein [Microbulbifer sp. MI-G]WKD49100.1 hypothetical protein M8T91_14535 [Microbulbifer sp. MI-G]
MKQFSELLIKILAAYLILRNLGNASPLFFLPEFWEREESLPIAPFVVFLLAPILIGIVLWVLAPKIAQKIINSDENDAAISERGVVVAGTFLIGVYWALRSIGIVISEISTTRSIDFGNVAVFVISLALILGGKFITSFYRWLRTAGTGI